MIDALVTAGILAAGILYIVALLYLIRWASLGLIWLKRRVFGVPTHSRWGQVQAEPFRDYQPETEPGAPVFGPAARPFFTLAALAIALSITTRLIFAAMGWEWPFGR